jgi:hypothetical protein
MPAVLKMTHILMQNFKEYYPYLEIAPSSLSNYQKLHVQTSDLDIFQAQISIKIKIYTLA